MQQIMVTLDIYAGNARNAGTLGSIFGQSYNRIANFTFYSTGACSTINEAFKIIYFCVYPRLYFPMCW